MLRYWYGLVSIHTRFLSWCHPLVCRSISVVVFQSGLQGETRICGMHNSGCPCYNCRHHRGNCWSSRLLMSVYIVSLYILYISWMKKDVMSRLLHCIWLLTLNIQCMTRRTKSLLWSQINQIETTLPCECSNNLDFENKWCSFAWRAMDSLYCTSNGFLVLYLSSE